MTRTIKRILVAAGLTLAAAPVLAQDNSATLAEIEAAFGFVPSFMQVLPPDVLPGAWSVLASLELSETTALEPKVKALISLAVAAQIPCEYCVWLDTQSAIIHGATEQEIREAVAMAALTRHWSTIFHGNQIDFDSLKAEFAGFADAADAARAAQVSAGR